MLQDSSRADTERLDPSEESRAPELAKGRREVASPYVAAESGLVDDVIDPDLTRDVLLRGFAALRKKPPRGTRSGNTPL